MSGHQSTIAAASLGVTAKATSRLTALHNAQMSAERIAGASQGALPQQALGHVAQVRVRVNSEVLTRKGVPNCNALQFCICVVTSLKTGGGFDPRTFSHSSLAPVRLPARLSRSERSQGQVLLHPTWGARTLFHRSTLAGVRVNALCHQQLIDRSADRLHLSNVLSRLVVSSGFQTNQTGLANAQPSFAPGAKEND